MNISVIGIIHILKMFMYEYVCDWNNSYIKYVVAQGHLCMNVSHQAKSC